MVSACSMHRGDKICRKVKAERHLEDLNTNGEIQECILKKYVYEFANCIRLVQDMN
jgi:hypothetical protein